LRRFALRFAHHRPREIEMNTKTTRRLASGTIANSGRFWVVPTQGPRLTDRHDLLGPYRAEGSAGHVRDKYLADGIPCEVIDSDERPVIEQAAHADQPIADDIATGLRALADMIEANPQHADLFRYTFSSINAFAADAAEIAEIARTARRHGAESKKDAKGDAYFTVKLHWGRRVQLHVNAHRDKVCERVVVGTREVTEEVPDPQALATVPTTTVTRTEDIVEWQCKPLLAAEQVQA
jgi:hypothetical protein